MLLGIIDHIMARICGAWCHGVNMLVQDALYPRALYPHDCMYVWLLLLLLLLLLLHSFNKTLLKSFAHPLTITNVQVCVVCILCLHLTACSCGRSCATGC
jgi:hypothetical protein